MKRIFAIIFIFFFIACKKDPATFKLDNLNNGEIGCFGHAGMGFHSIYPANSWPGFESCLSRGADGTEMDIHMTKDSVLVITHSTNLQETMSCSGAIKDLNWEDIDDCKIKSKVFKDSKLMSLEEFIEKIPNPKEYIFTWDIKLSEFNKAYYGVYTRCIVKIINKYDINNHVFIENPFADFLQHIKDLKSDTHLFILAEDFDEGLIQAKQRDFFGLSMHTNKVTTKQVKLAHDNNLRFTIYGVYSEKENYYAVEKCADFIQTDDINYLLKIFGKYYKGNGLWYSLTK